MTSLRSCTVLAMACGLLFGSALSGAHPAQAAPRASSHRATPPDSYLQYKVYSVDQLIQQVSSNPAVRARFARHFQIPEDRVVSYMRANLVESYIPRTSRYTVYCARRNGQFYPVKQTFKRGTKVFALRNGDPVMKWVCGNPLSKFLPAVQVKNLPAKVPYKVSPSLQELAPTDTANIIVPTEIAAPVVQPLVPIPTHIASSLVAPLVAHGGHSLLPFLLPVALLGVHTSGGGSTPGVPLPAVPEPGTLSLVLFALPLALVASCRRAIKASRE